MAETGCSQAAVERSNRRRNQQHYVTASFLAMKQEEPEDLSESSSSVAYVENSSDSGIFYLNPLTPKWNCGISEKCPEITSEEEEKVKSSEPVMRKINLLKAKKPNLVPQTSNVNSVEYLGDISSASSEEIWFQSKDNCEGRIAGKRTFKHGTPKMKLLKVQRHNLNQQFPNMNWGIMDNCSDAVSAQSDERDIWVQSNNGEVNFVKDLRTFCQGKSELNPKKVKKSVLNSQTLSGITEITENYSDYLSSPSEETEMWIQRKNNAEEEFARTSKEVTQKPIVQEEHFINPHTHQSTNGYCEKVGNRAETLLSESQENNCFKSQNSDECAKDNDNKKLVENDNLVTSKLKDLHVEENEQDGVKSKSKMSRLLEAMKKRGDIDAEQRPFKCPHCHWAFKKLCYLQSHVTTHSGLKPHVCDKCGKAYSHQGTLQQHKRLHTGERPYCCPFCDRSYIWSSDYRKHIRTHTGEKPYECKECGKDFIRSSDLRKHERNMHTNNKPFPCSHCGKTFNRPLSLKRHERKHLGERPYSCPDCGKKFALASRMAEHQKIHRGVRPFVCSVCGKCFTKSSNLTEHEAIHSGVRPHKCGECGVAFAMASRLVRHQYVHSKGKPYGCAGCGRNFSCLPSLEQHQQLTCAGRIFVCVQCDKSFMCADKLSQHMQHHDDKTGPN